MAKFHASTQYGVDWRLNANDAEGTSWTPDRIQLILLQEIRDELQRLNHTLDCQNTRSIPGSLKKIRVAVEKVAEGTGKRGDAR